MKRGSIVVAAVVVVAGALALVGWQGHERTVRLHDAPACTSAKPAGDVCGRCVAAFCCAEVTTCYGRTDCIDLNDCTVECGESKDRDACRARCASTRPQATAAFEAWNGCAHDYCESECPRGEVD